MTDGLLPQARRGENLALTGIRAFAVLAVVGFHVDATVVPGGFLGVGVFFVLSGFLITSLLVAEFDRDDAISLTRFYRRRAGRLYPALIAALLLASGLALAQGIGVARVLWSDLVGATYTTDLALAAGSESTVGPGWNPQWSLAVEWQFYLVWPLVILLLCRRRREHLARDLAFAVVAALGLRLLSHVLLTGGRTYFLPTGHLDELCVGAMVAALAARPPDWWRIFRGWWAPASVAAVFLVVLAKLTQERTGSLDFGVGTLLALLVGAGIAAFVQTPRSVPARICSWRPIWLVGTWSYGVYLFHEPIRLAVKEDGSLRVSEVGAATVVAATIGAALSLRYVESRWHSRVRPEAVPALPNAVTRSP